ncbi:MAG: site-specific integrase [Bdellovibrionaceae bacterium]|jgi:integrase|nr:site-specific integrase [Pseudobdellovibrionaceae bacterium]
MNELVQIDVSIEYAPKVYVHKRKWGWYWKFELPNGKWFYGRAPGDDEQSARRNASKKERELAKGLFNKKEVEKLQQSSNKLSTFEMAINDYIDHLQAEGVSPNYISSERATLAPSATILESKFRVKYVHKLTEDEAYTFRRHLLERVKAEEIKRVTAFNNLNAMKRLFKWLKKRKMILQNPWLEVEAIPVPKEERARTVAPSSEILPQLLSANYTHRYEFPIKEFAYGLFRTGARKEELLYLEVDDVNWETGLWIIRPKECPIKHGMKWSPKYGKTRETIIPADVLEMLKPLVERAINHRVVGYTPNKKGKMIPVDARFIFTMIDRRLSSQSQEPIYRRSDSVRGAWGALFVAAGLAEAKESSSPSTRKYKDGKKMRTDYSVPFTRHDMRRGFNLAAKEAGMSLDERSSILGHGREVNENHYCGKPKLDTKKIAEILNERMWKNENGLKGVG